MVALAVAATAAAMSAVAGCGTRAADVALPSKPAHQAEAAAKAVGQSRREFVIAAYEGYWRATNEALASRDPARARAIIAGYVPGGAIPALVRGLRTLWRKNEIDYGSPEFHIMSVQINVRGTSAVNDSINLLISILALDHGRGLVTGAIPVVQTCAY
jgi:hypothetical protein